MNNKILLVILVVGSVMSARAEVLLAENGSGASEAFTSDAPMIGEARRLLLAGDIAKAEQLIGGREGKAYAELLEVGRRMRREYGLDEPAMLAKLKPLVRDVTRDELRRWREADEIQHRTIDGEVRYFRREPSNLFRFCEEAKSRRIQPAPDNTVAVQKLTDHLEKVIAAGEKSEKPEVVPVKHTITFNVKVPLGPDVGAKKGSVARIWLPYPQDYRQQTDVKFLSSVPKPTQIAENGTPHRTLYYERVLDGTESSIEVKTQFAYTSYGYYPKLEDQSAKPLAADFDRQYLDERPPHIRMTPELQAKVDEIVVGDTNPLSRARKVYHWVCDNVRYCAEEEYCLIPGISSKAFASLKGDCGVQGTLFITMCRAAGVPARWQSGWETKPVNWNMHDWAEFYVEPWGWLPADPSYGLQKQSDDPRVREFYFGHQDAYRLIVNLDYGRPLVPGKTSLRSEPMDFQRGEVEIDGRNLYFDEWEHEFKFEQEE